MCCTRHAFPLVFSFVAVLRLSISPCLQKLQTIQWGSSGRWTRRTPIRIACGQKTSWPRFIQHVLWGRFVSASSKRNWKTKHPTEGSGGYKGAFPKCFDAWDAWHKWQREVLWPLIQQEACGGIVFASFFQLCSLNVLLSEKKEPIWAYFNYVGCGPQ